VTVRLRGLSLRYVLRRLGTFVLTIWLAATIIFALPRLMGGNPVAAMVGRISVQSGGAANGTSAGLVAAWNARFGLNDSVIVQYLLFLKNSVTFNFGFSITDFPATVNQLIGAALPWTLGLMLLATIGAFVVGSAIGALMAWRRTPWVIRSILPFSLTFTAIPSFMLGLLLLYVFSYTLGWFPTSNAYALGVVAGFNWPFLSSVITHGVLPALTIVGTSMGFWALSMRGMMVTIEGEDYMVLGEAKGLRPGRLFWRYRVRNAALPQVTSLALTLGGIISGQILVEYLFNYPGVGQLLYQGILNEDFVLVESIVFLLIVTTALAVLILDLTYPLLDPRISYLREAPR
jgi:peptide/nickel transport system permease protein